MMTWGSTRTTCRTGRRLDADDPREFVFTVGGGLTPADDHRLRVARASFLEASAEDFTQEGKDWVNRDTGERHRLVLFDPAMSEDPRDTGVTTFFVTGDGYLAYLRPVGTEAWQERGAGDGW